MTAKNQPDEKTDERKLKLTLGGEPIDPWWNMVALKRLKGQFGITMQKVLENVLDPDLIAPFYFVGLESRQPQRFTLEAVEEALDFYDLMTLQAEMGKLVKAFGLDTVPLPTTNGTISGRSAG